MAYKGGAFFQQPELESIRRMRESAIRLPDGSGFFTGTVETTEGGPGSGPRKGQRLSGKGSIEERSRALSKALGGLTKPDRWGIQEHQERAESHSLAGLYASARNEMSKAERMYHEKLYEKNL